MGYDWILTLTDQAGLTLPDSEIETRWRIKVRVFVFAGNLSRKSFEIARKQLSAAVNTPFSKLEVELFVSGIGFEEIASWTSTATAGACST
jgi:hypothetical protein